MTTSIYKEWIAAKESERVAVELRRGIEDTIIKNFEMSILIKGTTNFSCSGYDIKIVSRIDTKVDSDKLQELAIEHGLTDHLTHLFRWKAEINAKQFANCSTEITSAFAGAITEKPGRPSFTITPTITKE